MAPVKYDNRHRSQDQDLTGIVLSPAEKSAWEYLTKAKNIKFHHDSLETVRNDETNLFLIKLPSDND